MKKTIFVYDDERQIGKRWQKDLLNIPSVKSAFDVEVLDVEFSQAVTDLEQRRREARKKGRAPLSSNLFDKASVLIIDFDLFRNEDAKYLTGEEVAYLARCYSRCGVIIGINQFGGDNPFDLTLSGHPESFADLNLGGKQLSKEGLWEERWSGFRPWSWPLMETAVRSFESRTKKLLEGKNLDKPILEYLEFPDEVVATLPRLTREFLGNEDDPQESTFRDFVLSSGNGLRLKDKPISNEFIARIAAARISKWLERLILPGQDILVDAPHLVSRYPSLLKGDPDKLKTWNQTTSLSGIGKLGLSYQRIADFRFQHNDWLSRPSWFWSKLSNFGQISEVSDPWSMKKPEYVFCEDISQFVDKKLTREFVAQVASPFVRRFVIDPTVKEGRKLAKDADKVDYVPAVRFTL
jgi:hypothetical protein